jgi:two-component system, NtrC family, sensor kinase
LAQIQSFLQNIRRILVSLVEKYHPFNLKYFKALVFVIMTLLLGAVFILGWRSSQQVKAVVTDDFNQQQLGLARHVAYQIENSIDSLKREIQLLAFSPAIQYTELPALRNRMEITFSSIKHQGTLEIRYLEQKRQGMYHVCERHSCLAEKPLPEDIGDLEWAMREDRKGHIRMTSVFMGSFGDEPPQPLLKIMIPVWQVSVDDAHPVATNQFSGVLIFVIDASRLIKNITRDIRSGKTGYAWIIDENGMFLYHQEKNFIGQNAFEVRKGKRPTISFARINEIQKEKMLKGEEGTSWYTSGWHRGMEGEIRKLIAYTPIRVGSDPDHRIWSVAVVAPITEVEGAIHSIHIQQFILQGLIIFLILFGGLFINFMILSWSNILEQEVTKKTAELKKSEQKYKSLIENAEDIIFSADYQGNFLSINRYGAKFFEKTEEDVVGHNILEILSWPSAETFLLNIKRVFDTRESQQITHLVIIGERQCWVSTHLRRLFDEAGNIYAVLGISRDITERRKMEEHSYYTEKLASMGTLAAGVAHEINNPLGVILGFTDILLEKIPPDSEEYDLLKTIERQGLNAKRVVENLLNFARHKEHREELVNINDNIEIVLSVMNNTLLVNKIVVKKQLEDALPPVKADAGELQQVFFNLINNAIHAMQGGGILTITTASFNNDAVEICFADTGHGIKAEYRNRIFDPLFTTKEVGKGTGLGLSVSYGIITKHGGAITFETKTKEESDQPGTTFILAFPAAHGVKAATKIGE